MTDYQARLTGGPRAAAAVLFGIFLLSALWLPTALGQSYPAKPIKMLVPFPPGGPADLVSRLIAKRLSDGLGQQLVLENRAGAGGTIALELVAKSPPDGYTLILNSLSTMCIAPSLYRNLGYDPLKSFAPIGFIGSVASAVVVNNSVPAGSLRELIDLLKSRPGQINFGSNGNGTIPHLAAEYFKSLTGVQIVHVPYKGVAPAVNDLIAGQIQLIFVASYGLEQYARAGKLKVLAVASSTRVATLPDVPTSAEAGLPGFESYTWFGMAAPLGTPPAIIQRLNSELTGALGAKEVRDILRNQGMEPRATTPEQFAEFVASETAKWSRVIKLAGVRMD